MGTSLLAVNASVTLLKSNGDQLQNNLTAVQALITTAQAQGADCSAACAIIDASQLAMDVDFDSVSSVCLPGVLTNINYMCCLATNIIGGVHRGPKFIVPIIIRDKF